MQKVIPKGYVDWSPSPDVLEIVERVQAMIGPGGELETVLPVTVRQLFYRLIAQFGYPKTDAFAAQLGKHLTRARRARMIPFEAIHDQGIAHAPVRFDNGPEDQIELARSLLRGDGYRLDHQFGQFRRLIIWTEAAGLVRQIEAVAGKYGVETMSGGGQPSVTFNWQMARRLAELCRDGHNQIAEVLMLGDYDPAGFIITETAGRDVSAFAQADHGLRVFVQRIALGYFQVIERNIQTAPAKATDPRFESVMGHPWLGTPGDPTATAQLEAIPPLELQALVRAEIEERLEFDLVETVQRVQAKHVEVIRAKGAALDYRRLGRPPVPDDTATHIHALRADGLSVRAISAATGVAKSTVARLVQKVSAG